MDVVQIDRLNPCIVLSQIGGDTLHAVQLEYLGESVGRTWLFRTHDPCMVILQYVGPGFASKRKNVKICLPSAYKPREKSNDPRIKAEVGRHITIRSGKFSARCTIDRLDSNQEEIFKLDLHVEVLTPL